MNDIKGPIEVMLTQRNLVVECLVTYEDESTENLDVDSLSMRGAQREMTGWFIKKGYEPAGRWQTEAYDDGRGAEVETVRRFRPARALDVKAELQRRVTTGNISDQDFIQTLDQAVRAHFGREVNATGGSEEEMERAINDIAAFIYQRFRVLTPAEMRDEAGEPEENGDG